MSEGFGRLSYEEVVQIMVDQDQSHRLNDIYIQVAAMSEEEMLAIRYQYRAGDSELRNKLEDLVQAIVLRTVLDF
jgi:hypothetical protein